MTNEVIEKLNAELPSIDIVEALPIGTVVFYIKNDVIKMVTLNKRLLEFANDIRQNVPGNTSQKWTKETLLRAFEQDIYAFAEQEDRDGAKEIVKNATMHGNAQGIFRLRGTTGINAKWIKTMCTCEKLSDGTLIYYVIFQDNTTEVLYETQLLQKQAQLESNLQAMDIEKNKEGLTGLYNREYMEYRVSQHFRREEAGRGIFIILDLDNFKLVNDSYGHFKGDEVLRQVAAILHNFFRLKDMVCRLGGDEFAIFMPAGMRKKELNERLSDLCGILRFTVGEIQLTTSVGVCVAPKYGKSYQELYQNADKALLTAKRCGKNQYQIYGGNEDLSSHMLYRNMDWLLDELTDGVVVNDLETHEVIYVNAVAANIIAGKNKEDCVGKKCYEMFWKKRKPCEHCIQLDAETKPECQYEVKLENQEEYIVKGKLINWGGKKARVQYLHNITEKARLLAEFEKALEDKEELLDLLPGGLFRYEAIPNGEFNYISKEMLIMLGYTREEFVEKFENRFDLMVWQEDRERVLREIEEQIAHGNMDECHYRIEKKDKTLCWVKDIGHYVVDENEKAWFYVTITDITGIMEQKNMENS